MTHKRRGGMLIITIVMIIAITGCNQDPFQYSFLQERDMIEKVEICSFNDYDRTMELIVALSEEQIDAILNDFASLECRSEPFLKQPHHDYGDVIVCITYQNGEKEVFGAYNIACVSSNGEWRRTRDYFDVHEFRELLLKYVDVDVLAPISEQF